MEEDVREEEHGKLTVRSGTSGSMGLRPNLGCGEGFGCGAREFRTAHTKHDVTGANEDDVEIVGASDVGGSGGMD